MVIIIITIKVIMMIITMITYFHLINYYYH